SLARRLALVRQQQTVEVTPPRIDSWQRLLAALIAKLRRPRPDHLAHDLPRHPKLAADRLYRLLLREIGPTDLRDRLHYQHPRTGPHVPHGSHCGPAVPGVPIGCRSPQKRGPYSMPNHMKYASRSFSARVSARIFGRAAYMICRAFAGRLPSSLAWA